MTASANVRGTWSGWRARLVSRLAVAFFLPAATVGVIAGTVGFFEMRATLRESAYERMRAATAVREAHFDRWVNEQAGDLRFLVTVARMQASIAAIRGGSAAQARDLSAVLQRAVETQRDFLRIVILSADDGRVIAASSEALLGQSHAREPHFLDGLRGVAVQNVYPAPGSSEPTLTIAMPVRGADGETIAVLAGDANLGRVQEVVAERSGLGETGQAYLITRNHEFVRGQNDNRSRYPRDVHTPIIDRALSGQSGAGVYRDYRGREVVGVYRWLPERQVALFAEMSTDEAFAPAHRLAWMMLVFGLVAILILALGLIFVARRIARPILQIADAAKAVTTGNLGASASARTDDEIGELSLAFNAMTRKLGTAHGELESQLHATEEAARATEASRRLLRAVIDHLPALVAVKDLHGRYMVTNSAFVDYYRVEPETLIGRAPQDFLPAASVETIAALDARVMATRTTISSEEQHTMGTRVRTFLTARFPLLDVDGEMFGIGIVATDITERKRLESQILHQQKLEAVGRLAGGVAHDMNNLLTAVRCNAELLLDTMPPGHADRQPLEEIDRSVRNGSALIRQLLTFSRAHVVQPSALDVNRILGGMTSMLRRYVGTGIDMRFELGDGLWLLRADEGQVEQVLLNLLSNAHDAMPAGGTATVSTSNVVVGGASGVAVAGLAAGEYVRISVRDTGSGIDPDMIPLLFEPFFTTKEPGRGTGLGLSTAYAIVHQSQGAITVESVVGQGTDFSVYLPRHPDEPFEPPAPLPPRVPAASGVTLLVVDDEPAVRTVLRQMLALQGYRILEAQSGVDALETFTAHEDSIALVLTDVFMPEMSGTELAKRIRARRPSLPVVFMSGYTSSEVARRGLMETETRFLQKPFNRQHLLDEVARALREARPA